MCLEMFSAWNSTWWMKTCASNMVGTFEQTRNEKKRHDTTWRECCKISRESAGRFCLAALSDVHVWPPPFGSPTRSASCTILTSSLETLPRLRSRDWKVKTHQNWVSSIAILSFANDPAGLELVASAPYHPTCHRFLFGISARWDTTGILFGGT